MIFSLSVTAVTVVFMIFSVLFFPKLRLGRLTVDTHWIVTLSGALVLCITGQTNMHALGQALLSDSAVNPLKILVLFLSMTILSVFLDELGFFARLANLTLKKAGTSQKKLFFLLYFTVSLLTVFTSNDIIILSFTPFICYFAKHGGIDPMPYLTAEFVAANTWSMALVIGNPTNIYLASAFGVDFLSYLKVMLLPTLVSGSVSCFLLYLLFRKKLSQPIVSRPEEVPIRHKGYLMAGIADLAVCTLLLAVGSYVGWDMWIVALAALILLMAAVGLMALVKKEKPVELFHSLKRAPWSLVPFLLSMFVILLTLSDQGVSGALGKALGEENVVFKYGFFSFFSANVLNNIPMSVLFGSIIQTLSPGVALPAMYATVVGSNAGALLTPVGALAGLMFRALLAKQGQRYGYTDFLKTGLLIALPSLTLCLLTLFFLV